MSDALLPVEWRRPFDCSEDRSFEPQPKQVSPVLQFKAAILAAVKRSPDPSLNRVHSPKTEPQDLGTGPPKL